MTSRASFLWKCQAFPSSISPFLFLPIDSSIVSTNQVPQVEEGAEPGEATAAEVAAELVAETETHGADSSETQVHLITVTSSFGSRFFLGSWFLFLKSRCGRV